MPARALQKSLSTVVPLVFAEEAVLTVSAATLVLLQTPQESLDNLVLQCDDIIVSKRKPHIVVVVSSEKKKVAAGTPSKLQKPSEFLCRNSV